MTFSKINRLIALTAFGAAMACAGTITVTLDQSSQTGAAGDTLMFFGVIANTGSDTEFLNSDSLNLTAASGDFTTDDGPFFANAPVSLASSASTADIELFDVLIPNPFPDAFTSYSGLFTILGGTDDSSSDILTDPAIAFSVSAQSGTPEPSTSILIFAGFIACAFVCRNLIRRPLNLIWAARLSEYSPVPPCRANGSGRESEGSKHPIRRRVPSQGPPLRSYGAAAAPQPDADR